jgi:protein phosphatase
VRNHNEDWYLIDDDSLLYQIADGMGGHAAGDEASQLTVETIADFVGLAAAAREITWPFGYDIHSGFEHNVLRTGVMLANVRVFRVAGEMNRYSGMGSTAVVLWIPKGTAYFAHVGDSRLYLLRDNELSRLTRDHSLVQQQLDSGMITAAQAEDHALRHVVTRAVGMQAALEVDTGQIEVIPGDQFLLCTDGLTDELKEEQLSDILKGSKSPEQCCNTLVEAAREAGGKDNITAMVVLCDPE